MAFIVGNTVVGVVVGIVAVHGFLVLEPPAAIETVMAVKVVVQLAVGVAALFEPCDLGLELRQLGLQALLVLVLDVSLAVRVPAFVDRKVRTRRPHRAHLAGEKKWWDEEKWYTGYFGWGETAGRQVGRLARACVC